MFTLILILLGGFLAGFLLRRLPGIHFTDTGIPVTIFAMLFLSVSAWVPTNRLSAVSAALAARRWSWPCWA